MEPKLLLWEVSTSGLPAQMAKHVSSSIINAGDGWHEHPSQALLDMKTIIDHHGTVEGKIITMVGDIMHSRVFGSVARIIKKLGGKLRVACPLNFPSTKCWKSLWYRN